MNRSIRVLCVTPCGLDGRGGIDRLYYYLRQFHDANDLADIELDYFAARGGAPGALWTVTFPWRIALFVSRLALTRPHIVHLNFSNGGSILRKYVLMRIAKLFGAEVIVHFHGQFTAEDVAGRSPWIFFYLPYVGTRHASSCLEISIDGHLLNLLAFRPTSSS